MRRQFRFPFRAVAAFLCLGLPASAQDAGILRSHGDAGPLRGLHTADDLRDWEAVGRLDTGVSFCTATLIAPDLVLTAAHCLFDTDGARLPDRDLTFSAGLRHGRSEAVRQVSQSRIPSGYTRPADRPDMASIRQDVAVLRLDRPVPPAMVRPIALGPPAAPLSAVTLVSYGTDREGYPSIEEDCRILSEVDAVQVLSCHVVAGSSGAPVMRIAPEGPQIVGVVSGRSDLAGGDVTVAVVADAVAPALMADQPPASAVAAGGQGGSITIRRVGDAGASREGLGARFVRP